MALRKKKVERVTRDMIRALPEGGSVKYALPSYLAVQSARQTIAQMRRILGVDITCNEATGGNVIIITKQGKAEKV